MTISQKFKQARLRKNLLQQEAAKLMNRHQSFLAKVEKKSNISLKTAKELCKFYGMKRELRAINTLETL